MGGKTFAGIVAASLVTFGIYGAYAAYQSNLAAPELSLDDGTVELAALPSDSAPDAPETPGKLQEVASELTEAIAETDDTELTTQPNSESEAVPVPPKPPEFDLVRVDADGNTLVAGRALPSAQLALFLDGAPLEEARADGDGTFVAMLTIPPADRPRILSLEMTTAEGEVVSAASTIVISASVRPRPEPGAIVEAEPETMQAAPDAEVSKSEVAQADEVETISEPRVSDDVETGNGEFVVAEPVVVEPAEMDDKVESKMANTEAVVEESQPEPDVAQNSEQPEIEKVEVALLENNADTPIETTATEEPVETGEATTDLPASSPEAKLPDPAMVTELQPDTADVSPTEPAQSESGLDQSEIAAIEPESAPTASPSSPALPVLDDNLQTPNAPASVSTVASAPEPEEIETTAP
ncbi:MAG: hypothetical protein ACU0CA_05685, partial [Paracoccaceae bacterium]